MNSQSFPDSRRRSDRDDERLASSPAVGHGRFRVGFLFTMLFLLYLFDYADRQIVTSLFPYLKADLGISDTEAGLLISVVYWSIIIFAFPVSILIDRWSRRKSISIMVALWSIASGLAVFIRTFPQLLLTRLGVGVGEAGYSPGGTAMISALFPNEKRSRMMGIWNASIPLGSALGVAAGGIIATQAGWKHAFGLVAIPGFLLALLFFLFAKDYRTIKLEPTGSSDRNTPSPKGFGGVSRRFFHTPSLLFTYAAFSGNTFLTTAYLAWLPSYFNRYANLPMNQAGLRSASVLLFAMVGAPLGGFLVDAWMKRYRNARPLFSAITTFASSFLWFVDFAFLHGATQYVGFMIAATTSALFISGAAAITQDVVHPGTWAISYSLCVVIQNLIGSSLGPLFVGIVSDQYGLNVALTLVPIAAASAGVLFLLATRWYGRDRARAARVAIELE